MLSFLKDGVQPDAASPTPPHIPRTLWQTTKDRHAIRPELLACVEKLKAMNPTWEHRLFDDATQLEFLRAHCSERFMRAYARIHPLYGAARADLFRYAAIFLKGGAYLDLKSGTTRPLDDILRPEDRFIISQWDNGPDGLFPGVGLNPNVADVPGGEYEQWFVIAEPGHPYLAAVIERVLENIENYRAYRFGHGGRGILNVMGPFAYTRAIRAVEEPGAHRNICAWHEGLRYTMFDGLHAHQAIDQAHYGRKMRPPVTAKGLTGTNWLGYWAAEIAQYPVSRVKELNNARLIRRRYRKKIPTDAPPGDRTGGDQTG